MTGYEGADLAIALINVILLGLLFVVAIAIARMRSLFAIVMLLGIYSLISATWFVALDAVDVAFTEAAVGAGISTVLLLGAMLLTSREADKTSLTRHAAAAVVTIAAGVALFYALGDMPIYGDAASAANTGVGMEYVNLTAEQIHIPNVVTAVLASYRGFDTMGEVFVVFAAGLGVALLIGLGGSKRKED